nr:immunoglobulin light chain junction region [Macaca mulatta]
DYYCSSYSGSDTFLF